MFAFLALLVVRESTTNDDDDDDDDERLPFIRIIVSHSENQPA